MMQLQEEKPRQPETARRLGEPKQDLFLTQTGNPDNIAIQSFQLLEPKFCYVGTLSVTC